MVLQSVYYRKRLKRRRRKTIVLLNHCCAHMCNPTYNFCFAIYDYNYILLNLVQLNHLDTKRTITFRYNTTHLNLKLGEIYFAPILVLSKAVSPECEDVKADPWKEPKRSVSITPHCYLDPSKLHDGYVQPKRNIPPNLMQSIRPQPRTYRVYLASPRGV